MKDLTINSCGMVIWITGLSGAGKSTLAIELVKKLRSDGKSVVFLDGDDLREVFGSARYKAGNHGVEKRRALAMQYAYLCKLIASQGIIVVIATISLFQDVLSWNRINLPSYFEVYLKVPVSKLRLRDPKDIYRRFDAGELTDVAGLDLLIEEPSSPDITFNFEAENNYSVAFMVENLLKELNRTRG